MSMALWQQASRELLRALRGERSQVAFARRLGFRSNVPAAWEGGHRSPSAREVVRIAARVGIDVAAAVGRFHPPAAAAFSADDLGPWLQELRGRTSVVELAERTGCSPPQLQRWLGGRASPRLFQFLAVVDGLTGRAPDLVAELVDIAHVPSLAPRHRAARTQRSLAFQHPWTAAVRILIEARPVPADGDAAARLARALGQPPEPIAEALALLRAHHLVEERAGMLVAGAELTVDMRATAEERRRLRAHWAQVAAARVAADSADLFSFSLIAVSRADLEQIRQLQRRYFRELRGIVAASSPCEVGALVVAQVAEWPWVDADDVGTT